VRTSDAIKLPADGSPSCRPREYFCPRRRKKKEKKRAASQQLPASS
jgi:hypothetical protein